MVRALGALVLLLLSPALGHAQWPDRLAPVEVGDDAAKVRLSLVTQLQLSGETRPDADVEWDLRVRRIRPIVRASFLDSRITATLHIEANPSAPELIDAWLGAQILPALHLRLGQMKIPFTRYYQRSLTELAVDWPLTSRWFGGERQLGAMAFGADGRTGLGYALGVFAGQNRRSAFARELAGVYGEGRLNPSSFLAPAPTDPLHPEVVARIEHRGEGAVEHRATLSVAWDSDPVAQRDFALRLAPELEVGFGDLSAHVVAYAGFSEVGSGSLDLTVIGVLGELGWRAHRHLEMVARYGRVHLMTALIEDAIAQGTHPERTPPTAQHELSLAANVLIVGRSLTWQTDLAWIHHSRPGGDRDDLRVRTQMQLAF